MGALRTLNMTLGLLALVAGARPAWATRPGEETSLADPAREAEAPELHLQAIDPELPTEDDRQAALALMGPEEEAAASALSQELPAPDSPLATEPGESGPGAVDYLKGIMETYGLRQADVVMLLQQAQRLGMTAERLCKLTRGVTSIKASTITKLKSRLDLPALRLTEDDLERLKSEIARNNLHHPGNVRTMALYDKTVAKFSLRTQREFVKLTGIIESRFSEIRNGVLKVNPHMAQRLSDFHNREFPGEPATTPAYFLGK